MEQYCNNCGKIGHLFYQCKMPIASFGIICFRIVCGEIQYLMICRKNTLGFMDFIRGKYMIYHKDYIMNLIREMTHDEKTEILTCDFDFIWTKLWKKNIEETVLNPVMDSKSNFYSNEYAISKSNFQQLKMGVFSNGEFYKLNTIIEDILQEDTDSNWLVPEWGFPKGRRNPRESDYNCAIREFCEETGYSSHQFANINNILPFEEIFMGTNYKSYKHKYFLTFMDYKESFKHDSYDHSEVSNMEWKTYQNCIDSIRPYNLEKIKIIQSIHESLTKLTLCQNT
jgi:ADP-ribose pyrophosphatase YjhB (NUDIX family)